MLPLNMTIDHVSKGRIYDGAVEIGFNVTNPNASPVEVRGIYYNISKPGLKLVSGSIEVTQTIMPASR
jgi:LEA14-like dessication related protein